MDILDRLQEEWDIDLQDDAADEIERLREALKNLSIENQRLCDVLQKIADLGDISIPVPQTSYEDITWNLFGVAVNLAEDALKEDE